MKRTPTLPDVPTLDESGLKGFEAVAWNGLSAPAKTPRDIIAKINADVLKIIGSPELSERLKAEGSDPVGSTPKEYAAFLGGSRSGRRSSKSPESKPSEEAVSAINPRDC